MSAAAAACPFRFIQANVDDRALLLLYSEFRARELSLSCSSAGSIRTRFGSAINAIRDDEEKAEGMGLHTKRYKTVAWSIAAFFLGISGGIFGNMIGFIEPLEVAFPTVTFGIFMVVDGASGRQRHALGTGPRAPRCST